MILKHMNLKGNGYATVYEPKLINRKNGNE